MIRSCSLVLALAAVAACSTSLGGPEGPPNIGFSANPAVATAGGTVKLILTNSSSDAIIARPCPLALWYWNGSTWVVVPDGSFSCSQVEDTLAPGAEHNFAKPIDPSATVGTYRAVMSIRDLNTGEWVSVISSTFSVM